MDTTLSSGSSTSDPAHCDSLEKHQRMAQSHGPCTQVVDVKEAAESCLWVDLALAFADIWFNVEPMNGRALSLSHFLSSSVCLSVTAFKRKVNTFV